MVPKISYNREREDLKFLEENRRFIYKTPFSLLLVITFKSPT